MPIIIDTPLFKLRLRIGDPALHRWTGLVYRKPRLQSDPEHFIEYAAWLEYSRDTGESELWIRVPIVTDAENAES
jgi:hypothetical protein